MTESSSDSEFQSSGIGQLLLTCALALPQVFIWLSVGLLDYADMRGLSIPELRALGGMIAVPMVLEMAAHWFLTAATSVSAVIFTVREVQPRSKVIVWVAVALTWTSSWYIYTSRAFKF